MPSRTVLFPPMIKNNSNYFVYAAIRCAETTLQLGWSLGSPSKTKLPILQKPLSELLKKHLGMRIEVMKGQKACFPQMGFI